LEESVSSVFDKKACVQCEILINTSSRFCPACGAKQIITNELSLESRWLLLKQAALFYGIYILSCSVSKFVSFFNTLFWDLVFEAVLWITAVTFFADRWTENKRLFVWRNFSWQKLAAYLAIAMTGSVVVHYTVGWLNIALFSKEAHYFIFARGNVFYEMVVVLFTAVTPALFEEIAFRGYLLNILLKVVDASQAIYISAFLFAIIHLSFISLFWLIPFAIFIGYVRLKEDTLWYGICFHFAFNLAACLFELL
jgi:membrane protease YdiL (CAAX protease family)